MDNSTSPRPFIAISLFAASVAAAQQNSWTAPRELSGSVLPAEQVPVASGLAAAAVTGVPGVDDLTPIFAPDADYIERTILFEIKDPDFTVITSLSAGDCTLTFSPEVEVRTVPVSWSGWGGPPGVEVPEPRVLYSRGATSIEMTLNAECAASTFGFEAEPDSFGAQAMTATYYGDEKLGALMRFVDPSAGARLFAVDSDAPITSVVFSTEAAFALARNRIALPSVARVVFK